ncbi:MAG: FAD-binding protein [Deltaproteobacteria bacterium]|nr:FAD-binding protein [Deltaproteobacteria bacterium]MBW1914186.1 FAD-binding protein [Deltaproteobacteria bacterium]
MALEDIADRVFETDMLVVGGGLAGCPAAIKAAESGLNVILAEKAKTDRSGSAGAGIDHFMGPFPEDMTPADWLKTIKELTPSVLNQKTDFADPNYVYRIYVHGKWTINEFERLGASMKWTDGELRPIRFMMGGPFLRVHWNNVKPDLAKAVRKSGVNVLERTMIIDLLTHNGNVVGATAINSRTGEYIVIKAKAVVIATAACSRVYNPETPTHWIYKFNYHWCPASVSGDGWAMAYRAGAELANMEMAGRGYRARDDKVLSWGNVGNEGIDSKRFTWDGEERTRRRGFQKNTRFDKLEKEGRDDPQYVSLHAIPEDFHKRIEVAYVDERLVSFKIAEDRGFNPRTHWYELMDNRANQLHIPPGIYVDGNFQTNTNGLFAIGDTMAGGHGSSTCVTSGLLVGDDMQKFIIDLPEPEIDEAQVESQKQAAMAPLTVKDGTSPLELESSIRYICDRYIGVSKSEGKLREGIRRLRSLRKKFLPQLMAKNPHEQMRCLEVRNLMDIAEVHINASLSRTESRQDHERIDYPDQNPEWDGMLSFQYLKDDEMTFEMRKKGTLDMNLRVEKR